MSVASEDIQLGDVVQCRHTGFVGVAMAFHTYINGCRRVTVQPKVKPDKTLPDPSTFDDTDLVVKTRKNTKTNNDTGGPSKYEDNRRH